MNFNDSQMTAINHREGPCLVVAGPGSGKTAVITHRIYELIKSGIPSSEILVITFTKAAAIEMKERFNRLSGNNQVTFGTFHSLFWGILQREMGYKSKDIVMGSYRQQLITEAVRLAGLDNNDMAIVSSVSSEISVYENKLNNRDDFNPETIDKEDFLKVLGFYRSLKTKYKVVDFDDMLIKAYELFRAKPNVLEKWQKRFSYFLVDEMQDMNDLQFDLISMLSERTKNLFCVGDDDQSIYGFRGANPKIMSDFSRVYPDCKKILLNYNYRNPSNVVESASRLIANNTTRFSKEIISTNEAGEITIETSEDELSEANYLCEVLKEKHKNGLAYDDMVVLFRNHNDAKYLINQMMINDIPYFLKEGAINFYSHFIIEDIEAYFQIAVGNSTRARLLRIMNHPNRYLHRASIEQGSKVEDMLYFYRDNYSNYKRVEALQSDIILISRMSPLAAISYIRKVVGYDEFLRDEALKQGVNLEDYFEILDFLSEVIRDCKNINQAIDKINMLRYKVDFENKNRVVDKTGKVGMYTLHSSKGLEFDTVFIMSVNEGIIPTNKAETKEDLEGERRLFYVGMTRCKRSLYITYTNKKNRDKSRFLNELKLN